MKRFVLYMAVASAIAIASSHGVSAQTSPKRTYDEDVPFVAKYIKEHAQKKSDAMQWSWRVKIHTDYGCDAEGKSGPTSEELAHFEAVDMFVGGTTMQASGSDKVVTIEVLVAVYEGSLTFKTPLRDIVVANVPWKIGYRLGGDYDALPKNKTVPAIKLDETWYTQSDEWALDTFSETVSRYAQLIRKYQKKNCR